MLTRPKVAKIGPVLFGWLLLSVLPVLGEGPRRAHAVLLPQAADGAAKQCRPVDRPSTRTIAVEASTAGCDWNLTQCQEAGGENCDYTYCLCRADGAFWESLGCALFND